MTTPYERTLSVIEAGRFLAMLSRDRSLPDNVRDQAKRLFRHYPTPQAVRLAGRCEGIRQDEISRLPISPQTLHPALATWPLLEPFFCDSTERDTSEPAAPPASVAVSKLQSISGTAGARHAVSFQVMGQAQSTGAGCLSFEYRCFSSARALALSRATVMLGSRAMASTWFESPIRSLNKRKPCTLMGDAHEFTELMDVLIRIEYGIYY